MPEYARPPVHRPDGCPSGPTDVRHPLKHRAETPDLTDEQFSRLCSLPLEDAEAFLRWWTSGAVRNWPPEPTTR